MTRKSQVEKFNARMGKKKADTVVIREAEAKAAQHKASQEGQVEEMTKQVGINTEDVIAVITREGAAPFAKMFTNSAEESMKAVMQSETFRDVIRSVVREVVADEIASAVRGVFRGLNDVVKDAAGEVVEEAISFEVKQHVDELLDDEKKEDEPKRKYSRKGSIDWGDKEFAKNYMFSLLEEAEALGVDITKGKQFKQVGGKFNTAYQKGLPALYDGARGAWKLLLKDYRNR